MTNIISSLNAGSGIDLAALTQQLVAAEKEPRQKLLDQRLEKVEAKISAQAQFLTAADALVSALDARISSGALSGIPSVSDPSILSLEVKPGEVVAKQSLEVKQLARYQSIASAAIPDDSVSFGAGTLTFDFGKVAGTAEAGGFTPSALASLVVTIEDSASTLEEIKSAINQAAAAVGAGIEAQIIQDSSGARLVIRGDSGEDYGFTVTSAGSPALAAFDFHENASGVMSRTQAAQDSIVAVDGLELRRSGNTITDIVPNAVITLHKTSDGASIAVGATREKSMLTQTVQDVAEALNELAALGKQLMGNSNSVGSLIADGATRRSLQQLSNLTSKPLIEASGLAPTRMSDIGITLDRNGNFIVDETRMARAVEMYPAQVEAIITALNKKATFDTPAGALRQIATSFREAAMGTTGNPPALQKEKEAIAKEQVKLDLRITNLEANYKKRFAALETSVHAYKSLQTYMQQQIDLWTKKD